MDKMQEFSIGEIVWARLGVGKMWPGVVISGHENGKFHQNNDNSCIFWYGDHRSSMVPHKNIVPFAPNFASKYKREIKVQYNVGVIEAISECAKRAQIADVWDEDSLLNWAKNGFLPSQPDEKFLPKNPENSVPDIVRSRFFKNRSNGLNGIVTENPVQKVRDGHVPIEEICIACNRPNVIIVCPHPLFKGGLCTECKEDVQQTMFIFSNSGSYEYCAICGSGGDMIICDNSEDCNRVYCNICVTLLVDTEEFIRVQAEDPWHCYLCQTSDDNNRSLLKRRDEWKDNLRVFYQPTVQFQIPTPNFYKNKKPIRALSLFDGIATGKLALDKLGIVVDEYYAAEIELEAINVSTFHFNSGISQLGKVQSLSDHRLEKLCPIDILMGGSPCNELSLVNPARKGIYDATGSGILFFEFFRILQKIIAFNKGVPLFWLFENVVSMPQETKSVICRFLGCEPALINAKYFSPQNRARYFWGNIPGLYSPLPPSILNSNIKLNSVLVCQCNRVAVVDKIRTVTTRTNSLKQGRDQINPVLMDGKEDGLWVVELERVFGFPSHYTDVGNIPISRRQTLLGKSWSVPVIMHILEPLKEYFLVESDKNGREDSLYNSAAELNARPRKMQRCN